MNDEPLLAVMATPSEVPGSVERSRWPVHVTIAGNFRVDETEATAIPALLGAVAHTLTVFTVVLGPRELFGSQRDMPVLLASHRTFDRLHESLAAGLRELPGFAAAEPAFWGSGYRPHVTMGPAVNHREGDAVSFTTLTLVSLHGNTGERVAAVELTRQGSSPSEPDPADLRKVR